MQSNSLRDPLQRQWKKPESAQVSHQSATHRKGQEVRLEVAVRGEPRLRLWSPWKHPPQVFGYMTSVPLRLRLEQVKSVGGPWGGGVAPLSSRGRIAVTQAATASRPRLCVSRRGGGNWGCPSEGM